MELVERFLSPDGSITSWYVRAAVVAVRIATIALGIYLVFKRPNITPGHLALIAFSVLFCLAACEILLRVFSFPPPFISGWRSATIGVAETELNQLGFRGRPIESGTEDRLVLLVGDSQVEAMAHPFDKMPERYLETHLRALGKKVQVRSLGCRGYGQDQQLLALREFFQKRRADVVILWQTDGNDVWNNTWPTHFNSCKPTFWLEEGELRGPGEEMGDPVRIPFLRLHALWRLTLDHYLHPEGRDEKWEKRLPAAYEPMVRYDGRVHKELDSGLDLESGRNTWPVLFSPPGERTLYGVELTRLLTREIDGLVRSKGGELVTFLPRSSASDKDGDGRLDNEGEERVYSWRGGYYRTVVGQNVKHYDRVNEGLRHHEVRFELDDWRLSDKDHHLNDQANDLAMKDLAELIQDLVPARDEGKSAIGKEERQP